MQTVGLEFRARLLLLLAVVLLAAWVTPATARAAEVPRRQTLEAIHAVENPRDSRRPGPRGELGPYQFRERTWRMHTTLPFARALDREASDQVARSHYDWVCRQLRRHGFPVTPYTVALAWNAGVAATVSGRVPSASREYAARVEAIAEELNQPGSSAIASR